MKQTGYDQTYQTVLLELSIDNVIAAEKKALAHVDQTLERQKLSPKRRKSIESLNRQAEFARQEIKLKAARKIKRLKMRAGVINVM